ncbi:hypothetical protein EUGRSUZ_B00607 [Eucalyptus grandis]|uniref:Uncharacterized protein n=2 Tax=Eucalyptus grandis TaxID=71139 RepID=A0ACC3LPS2_EUCGR|nr:hypothetical protein EUGRSUZ_B00607 [Eucalyptus grandis]
MEIFCVLASIISCKFWKKQEVWFLLWGLMCHAVRSWHSSIVQKFAMTVLELFFKHEHVTPRTRRQE